MHIYLMKDNMLPVAASLHQKKGAWNKNINICNASFRWYYKALVILEWILYAVVTCNHKESFFSEITIEIMETVSKEIFEQLTSGTHL